MQDSYGYSLFAIGVGILMFVGNTNCGVYIPSYGWNVNELSYDEHYALLWASLTLIIGPLAYISGKRRGLRVATDFLKVRKYLEIGALIVMVLLPVLFVQFTSLDSWWFVMENGNAWVLLIHAWIIIAYCLVVI